MQQPLPARPRICSIIKTDRATIGRLTCIFCASVLTSSHLLCLAIGIQQNTTLDSYRQYYYLPEELGVQHAHLLGTFQLPFNVSFNTTLIVSVQFFLHAFVDELQAQQVTGIAFVEDASEEKRMWSGHITQPKEVTVSWDFPLILTDLSTDTVYRVNVARNHVQQNRLLPYYFQTTLQRPVSCLQVSVEGWSRSADVCFNLEQAKIPPFASGSANLELWYQLPLWRQAVTKSKHNLAQMIQNHLLYHLAIGFKGALLYLSPFDMSLVLASPAIRSYARSGKLVLVLWTCYGIKQLENKPYPFHFAEYDQGIQRSYAILRFASLQNRGLFMVDLDEYLVMGSPGMYAADLVRCIHGNTTAVAAVSLLRSNYRLSEELLAGSPEITVWEHPMWESSTCHPLHLYTHASEPYPLLNGKQVVLQAQGVYAFHIHEAALKPGWERRAAHKDCAHVVHLSQLWRTRSNWSFGKPVMRQNESWHWVFAAPSHHHGGDLPSFPCHKTTAELVQALMVPVPN